MAVQRLTDYTRRIWTALGPDAPEGHDIHVNDIIYYMDNSECCIVSNVYPDGSIDCETLPDIGGGGGSNETVANALTSIPMNAFTNAALSEKINFMNAVSIGDRAFKGVTGLKTVVFPAVSTAGAFIFSDSSSLNCVDFGPSFPRIKQYYFSGQYRMTILILRSASVVPLDNNGFSYTAFASGQAGGTLYVPQALIESYQNATNWSAILAYANNQILPIEGSIYETQYADGTPIP